MLMVTTALLASLVAALLLPWGKVVGLPVPLGKGDAIGFLIGYDPGSVPHALLWHGLRPATPLLSTGVVVAVALLVLAARRSRLAGLLALPVTLVLGYLCAVGSPLPEPWNEPSHGIHLGLGLGYWSGIAALLLAGIVTVLSLRHEAKIPFGPGDAA
jgi:hypothetical protein